jgi:hypothetical protein
MIYLLGYTDMKHTNYWPWSYLCSLFSSLGYESRHVELGDVEEIKEDDVFICWMSPYSEILVEMRPEASKATIVQKLTSLDDDCKNISWGKTTDDAFEFYKSWNWPIHQRFARMVERGHRCYAFGAKTQYDSFPVKRGIMNKYRERIFEIPWGSYLWAPDEVANSQPIITDFQYDIGYVGSRWGWSGYGNVDDWDAFLKPLLDRTDNKFVGGIGTDKNIIDSEMHKKILQQSRLCPIMHCASWRAERGVMDRFWTIFSAGRFGVCDNEGVYDFFDENDVVVETSPESYFEKSTYFMKNVDQQLPYIESVLVGIKRDYNMGKIWYNIIGTIYRKEISRVQITGRLAVRGREC